MIYIIAGVSGSGKTTIGQHLSERFGFPFYDADDYHPQTNIDKLSRGIPLQDEDRIPWLRVLASNIRRWNEAGGAVLACSALKESYREILSSVERSEIKWIFLNASKTVIADRLTHRQDHFFNPDLLDSQFETLELPDYGIHVDVSGSTEEIMKKIDSALNDKAVIGLIGLGVMGKSLALNMAESGHRVAVYNRHVDGVEVDVAKNFVTQHADLAMQGFDDSGAFIEALQEPRTVFLMVNAGKAVDMVIEALLPLLSEGDAIIDGGNSHFNDTRRREEYLADKGLLFLGTGVSGGEEGARKGPSIMPGGTKSAYDRVAPILESIAAKDRNGKACCSYVGPGGAGHFVKMLHNGVEYAEMQLIAEVYQYLRYHLGHPVDEIIKLFALWNNGRHSSYLLEISAEILQVKEGNDLLIDKILDKASNKGTGGWSTEAAIRLGQPLSTIAEALMFRYISSKKEERVMAALELGSTTATTTGRLGLDAIENAFYLARLINHAIGFELMREASNQYNWNLNLKEIARTWTNGCIIRSGLMEQLAINEELTDRNLLITSQQKETVTKSLPMLKEFVADALKSDCAVPVFSAALNYLLAYKTENSPANLIQAQRDFFGAHTYERTDRSGPHHTIWQKD